MPCSKILSFLAVIGALALGSVASADTITYGPTSFGSFAAGSSGGFSVPQFNPSLGTLTQVDLFVTGDSDGGSNGLQNLSGFPGEASVSIGTNITVSGPASLTVLTFPASTNSGPVAPFGGAVDFTFSGPDSILVNGTPSSDSNSDSITSGMSPYIGLSTVGFSYGSTVNTSSSASVSPTFSSTTPPTFDFNATVIYHYNAVPEPGTYALLGIGCLALLGYRRIRR